MIVIKNIEILKTDRDFMELISMNSPFEAVELLNEKDELTIVPMSEVRELVKGIRFKRPPNGEDIIIGISKQAQEIIGIQYEAWDNLKKLNDDYFNRLIDANNKLKKIKGAGFFKRVGFVFGGLKEILK